MNNREFEAKVKVSLIKALSKWNEEYDELLAQVEMYWGEDTINRMAEASTGVLMSVLDIQDYLKKENL